MDGATNDLNGLAGAASIGSMEFRSIVEYLGMATGWGAATAKMTVLIVPKDGSYLAYHLRWVLRKRALLGARQVLGADLLLSLRCSPEFRPVGYLERREHLPREQRSYCRRE